MNLFIALLLLVLPLTACWLWLWRAYRRLDNEVKQQLGPARRHLLKRLFPLY